jgi:Na+-transporting NADH:ubiquinone oxidoreductase subunit E
MAIGFMSFGGMLTGGDEEKKEEAPKAEIMKEDLDKAKKEAETKLTDNTKKITE